MRLKTQTMLKNNTETFKLFNLLNTIKRWEMEALRTGRLKTISLVLKKLSIILFVLAHLPAPLYYVYTYLTPFRYQVRFIYDSYYRPIRLRRVVKCVTSGDVASGLAKCLSAEYLESAEKLRIFRRRYIIGILTNKVNISI